MHSAAAVLGQHVCPPTRLNNWFACCSETGAIVGARNARQAEEVMRAGELRLADEEVNEIEAFAETAA